ncbi:RNA polymerase sigma factor, sigma-70 family [Bernardetia litoralis DSM 6794]|uniref:RNA polymerase sigma factor, sigma-70 family n=1 Tax=Bernardetia litoralis (strain ATCC 23117 / DSM 6794 / NBRC 15988 / NCIMB 1366 / Fx l1 / Sio-4) TaxID=880071 RepID=I4AKU1_BERLS|nr:RNA polymerase sigma factor [Bernardetia litoralis]AFM04576.1 RNA polymerase sigma factor, sigma-70 family [Bernardetia litoralis DSM 6794]
MSNLNDLHATLLESIALQKEGAFEEFYALFSEKVYNTALSYVQNTNDAEEITQDVFVKIHKNASKFKGNSSVNTWIYRITVNTSLNAIKKRKRLSFLSFTNQNDKNTQIDIPDFVHPNLILENKEEGILIFKAIKKLPQTQQTAFILAFVEELPRQEIAQIMETSLKAVESLLQRAKTNLKKTLKNYKK